jgi:hypothetical protein
MGMCKVRPKRFMIYTITTFIKDASCQVTCYPQQKWCATGFSKDNKRIMLVRKNIVLEIPKEDFEKNWMVV